MGSVLVEQKQEDLVKRVVTVGKVWNIEAGHEADMAVVRETES